MNDDHKISPVTPSKLSSDQIKQLLQQADIVDPAQPGVEEFLELDGSVDPQTKRPVFYPYYQSSVVNGYTYLIKEESLELWQDEVWEQFDRNALKKSSDLTSGFENGLELELPYNRFSFISAYAAEAKNRLTSSNAVCLRDHSVLGGMKELIKTYIIENLEHVLSGWIAGKTELDDVLLPFASLLGDYYFIEYLKWKSVSGIEGTPNIPFHEIISDTIESKKENLSTSFKDEKPRGLNQRELIILLKLSNKKWGYLTQIEEIEQVHLQFIGILTGSEPVSFANQACRLVRYKENDRDGLYLRNLLARLTNPKLSKKSLKKFHDIVVEIKKILDSKQL